MNVDLRRLPACLAWGAFWGAAAWSAYAVVEFAFSSLLFGFTRPYAVFPAWHFHLTALLVLAYLIIGPVTGAIGGLVAHLVAGRDGGPPHFEFAATIPLTLVFLGNGIGVMISGLGFGGVWQTLAAAVLTMLLIAGMLSPEWTERVGLLPNPWIISGLMLGLGQEFDLVNMSVAAQLGSPISKVAIAFGVALVVAVVLAVFGGRRIAGALGSRAGWASIAAGVLLFASCEALSISKQTVAEAASPALSTSARPNVVLIVMDTVRADHLSAQGYQRDTTPNLKALARDSVVYGNAISASDITLTSHASLFTGMYASWHNAFCQPPEAEYGREIAKQYPTLAEVLHRGGYETIGVAANLYLRADFGLERGFDQFQIPRPVPMLPDESRSLLRHRVRRWMSYAADTAQFDRLYSMGEDIDNELFRVMARRARPDAPFFAFLNYMDAHFPYVPPAPYSAAYPGRHPHNTPDDLEAQQYVISAGGAPPREYAEHCVSQYDGGIAYEDAQIGRVVEWLKRHQAYDNTMIVVTSDHGEGFGDRRRVTHANGPYQSLVHVGLMIKYPKAARRGDEPALASLTDVAPTILGAASVAIPATMQGRDLASVQGARDIYNETFPCPVIRPTECRGDRGCATKSIYSWPYKFIASTERGGKYELFDLSVDPGEKRNLIVREAERAAELRARLEVWSKAQPVQTRGTKQVDVDKRKALEGLGYIAK
jgi:arylsulfatase A-like enzyme